MTLLSATRIGPCNETRRVLQMIDKKARYLYPMTAARRAPRGTVKDAIGIFARIDPDLYEALEEAVSERGITKRELIVAAIRAELAHPTVTAAPTGQDSLYDDVA